MWVQLQRELRAKGMLSMDAVRRLDNLGFPWRPIVRHQPLYRQLSLLICFKVQLAEWLDA